MAAVASTPAADGSGSADVDDDGLDYSDYYSSSDDELDWDPDRERLIRYVRQSQNGGGSTKSLADRRNEWRESRGLERRKTVQELLAERREARAERERSAAAASAAMPGRPGAGAGAPGAPPIVPLSAASSSNLVEPRASEEATTELPATASSTASSTNPGSDSKREQDSSRGRTRLKLGWPWRGTK